MTIAREDVNRMKELAEKVAVLTDPWAIHQLEHGFVDYMTAKYGKPEAIRMLTKVWKLSARLRSIRGQEEQHE